MAEPTSSLLPCPFCGSSNVAVNNERPSDNSGGYFVECGNCEAGTNLRYACGDDPVPLLVEQWNTRAPLKTADLPLAARTAPERIWLDLGVEDAEHANFAELGEVTWSPNNATGHGIAYVRADAQAAVAPDHPPMPEHWSVVAEVGGEDILCISSSALSGKGELSEAEEQAVIGMARHLLAFVGYGLPPCDFNPDDQAVEAQAPAAVAVPTFEAWAKAVGGDFARHNCGPYVTDAMKLAGMAWRAALAATQAEVQTVPVATNAQEVQWRNIKKVVNALADFCFGSADDPRWGHAHIAIRTSLTAKDGLDVLSLGLESLYTAPQAQPTPALPATEDSSAGDLAESGMNYTDAYAGARGDLSIWKRRALEAERDLRAERDTSSRLVAEINAANGPTHLGEAASQAQPYTVDFDAIVADIQAIDTRHRGDPSYEHDPVWVRSKACDVVRQHARLSAAPKTQPAPVQAEPVHPDDAAVDSLAAKMKAKLAKQRAKGYGGWDTPKCSQQRLSDMLRDHVAKGDPVDVANFCAFLTWRDEGISEEPQAEPKAWLHQVVAADGEPDQALSFAPDNFPLAGVGGFRSIGVQPLYTARQSKAEVEAEPVAKPPGIEALMCVISSLRDTGHISDEEGELTNDLRALRDWAQFQRTAPQAEPVAKVLGWVRKKNGEIGSHFFTYEPHCDCSVRDNGGEKIAVIAATAPQAQPADAPTQAALDVLAERRRQVEVEGWTPERDDQYVHGDMASAAGCYAMYTKAYPNGDPHHTWPWDKAWWKPSPDTRRNRVKACALLLAEIERLDRAAMAAAQEGCQS